MEVNNEVNNIDSKDPEYNSNTKKNLTDNSLYMKNRKYVRNRKNKFINYKKRFYSKQNESDNKPLVKK